MSFRKKYSEEERAEFKRKRLESKSKLSLPYQLGYHIGERIVSKYLLTLSVDGLQTNNVISVTPEEEIECKRLDNIWFGKVLDFKGTEEDKHKATKLEWDTLRAYHEMLEEKYLPKIIECRFGILNITDENMKEFKQGLVISLWDCDCSHYACSKIEDVDVKDDDYGFLTVITLKR